MKIDERNSKLLRNDFVFIKSLFTFWANCLTLTIGVVDFWTCLNIKSCLPLDYVAGSLIKLKVLLLLSSPIYIQIFDENLEKTRRIARASKELKIILILMITIKFIS